jgi:hypothetical protein
MCLTARFSAALTETDLVHSDIEDAGFRAWLHLVEKEPELAPPGA